MHSVLSDFTPVYNRVLRLFEHISAVPRPSGHEEQIRNWLIQWAEQQNLSAKTDAFGNLVLYVPASPGCESAPTVILQGHMDMVCEKKPHSNHDFSKDSIQLIHDGDWLRADGTTLGADNGIAIAIALAIASSPEYRHPALEICLTVEEETGLTGAANLDISLLSGHILINIDSEDEGVITVGCAGGQDSNSTIPLSRTSGDTSQQQLFVIEADGMLGGHSGVDIAQVRANALRVLGRALREIEATHQDLHIISMYGGNAHNAIPRSAVALVQLPDVSTIADQLTQLAADLRHEFQPSETSITLTILPYTQAPQHIRRYFADTATSAPLTTASQSAVVQALLAYPHGVEKFSGVITGLVETSCNLATIRVHEHRAEFLLSQRSSIASGLRAMTDRIRVITALLGGQVENPNSYPMWEPDFSSPLLEHSRKLYQQRFGEAPVVETIHAGLECGIIGAKQPGMEMISIGPTIQYPHSPDERLHLPSLLKTVAFVTDLLASYV